MKIFRDGLLVIVSVKDIGSLKYEYLKKCKVYDRVLQLLFTSILVELRRLGNDNITNIGALK